MSDYLTLTQLTVLTHVASNGSVPLVAAHEDARTLINMEMLAFANAQSAELAPRGRLYIERLVGTPLPKRICAWGYDEDDVGGDPG